MGRATATALTVIRVPRGTARPDEEAIRAALERDRARLHLPQNGTIASFEVAGPYALEIEGEAIDEYVVWET